MADAGDHSVELLFFDTFSHENTEELNLDLVQFPYPVIIYEVRIIPLRAQVQANLPGGVRLGATNPSSFKLELFVNNLSRPNSATFEKLGLLDYKENTNIQLTPEAEVPTDGLVLKGWYNTVTVAVYGCLTTVKPVKESPPPPPPPPPRKVQESRHEPTSVTEEELCKSAPGTQHPLDFIQHQLQQLQQRYPQQGGKPPGASGSGSVGASPGGGQSSSSRDIYKPFEKLLQPHAPRGDRERERERERESRDRDSHDQRESRERKREYAFPPEPKEPYDARDRDRDSHDDNRSRDSRDRDDWECRRDRRGSRDSDSRDSHEYSGSREGSHDGREFRDRDRDRARHRDRDDFDNDRDRDHEREREREQREREQWEREREWEREKEKELEREREREMREREMRERELRERELRERETHEREIHEMRERELREREMRERELRELEMRERELRELREREAKERELREMEMKKEREMRERELRERELRERELREQQEREKQRQLEERERAQARPRTPPMPQAVSPERSRSQSPSRSRSPVVHDSRPPEPPMPPEEEMDVHETAEGEDDDEDAEMYENLSESSPQAQGFEHEPQEGEDGYEDISSDDELNDAEEQQLIANFEMSEDMAEDTWTSSPSMFNPLQCYLAPLGMFKDPSLSTYEVEVQTYQQIPESERQRPPEAKQLMELTGQHDEHTEKWVTGLETAAPLMTKGLSYLLHIEKRKRVLDVLINWTLEGLDEKKAMEQPEPAFKVRHLKMGIGLAASLLTCEPSVTRALVSRGVQSSLMNLLESSCMAFSIRLQILKALDASLRFPDGVRWFLGSHPDQDRGKELTCYQRIVQLMAKKQLAQVMMGLKALIRKVHVYEMLMKLRAGIDNVLDALPSVDEEDLINKIGSGEEGDDEMHPAESSIPVDDEDVEKIIACLEEIHRLIALSQYIVSQPKSLLPVKSLSGKAAKPADYYPPLFRLAYHCRLLECLFVLVSTPAIASLASVFLVVRRVIRSLLQTQEGLLFLSARPDTTNGIIRSLVQMTDEACEEEGEDMLARQLGLEMVYHLQTLQHIDQLFEYHKKVGDDMKVDDSEPLGILHSLCSMTFTPQLRDCVMGRRAIAYVFGLANNLSVLLPFIQPSGDEARDTALRKSVCWGYATQLLNIILMYSDRSQVFEKFGSKLLTISESNSSSSKLAHLQDWLAPVKKLNSFGVEEVGTMATLLKTYAEEVSKLPPSLVTILRLLHNLAIPPQHLSSLADEYPAPLHHTYALVELYSADCFPVLVNILQKLSELQLKPWQQGIPQSLDHWTMFFAAVMPSLAIVKAMLSLIIQTRGSEFKDLTILPTLFELHTVLCSVPSSSLFTQDTAAVQKNIVDTLLAFTQPDFKSLGEEALSSSLWTLMMKEVIRYPLKSPYVYMSGLLLISELVPLPFPLLSKEPLSSEEVSLAINTRKLWSVHLHPLMPDIHSLISLLAGTGCQPLLSLLRRVCWQIADLAAPSATIIAKCLLDVYLEQRAIEEGGEEEKKEMEKEKDGSSDGEVGMVTPMTTKILSLVSCLLSQPGIKAAVLQLISTGSEEEKYKVLLPMLVQTMNLVCSKPQHIQAQEAIVSVLQSLCDQEITLVSEDTSMTLEEQLACNLPDKELMLQIVNALLEHISNAAHSYASLLPCVRTLVMLTEHDYGFYYLKLGLESTHGCLVNLLRHIKITFSKDSSDCLSTLSTILELLRLLITTDEVLNMTRTRSLSRRQLCHILDWVPGKHHPLTDLEEMSKEEETLESLSESITSLVSFLRDEKLDSNAVSESWEVTIPPCLPLLDLFAQRSVYTLADSDDDRLNVNCWLANPAQVEPDAEPEVVRCDLLAWCQRYLPDLDLTEELKKETEEKQEDVVKPKRPKGDRRKSQEVININRGRPGKKPFVAPMRGRGIMAQSMMSGRGHDLFRSRPPNTSRPPSMHVDDFVKMEENRSQMQPPLQPTPTGPPPPRREKEIPRGRGGRGGMDRGGRGGFNSGGHFFTPPGNYARREPSPHGSHSGPQIFATPQIIQSHRPKPDFPGLRQFGRGGGAGGHDNQPGLLERHGGRDNRFGPRGGRGPWFGGRGKDLGPGFMGGGGGSGGFHGRRDPGRHVRSYTK